MSHRNTQKKNSYSFDIRKWIDSKIKGSSTEESYALSNNDDSLSDSINRHIEAFNNSPSSDHKYKIMSSLNILINELRIEDVRLLWLIWNNVKYMMHDKDVEMKALGFTLMNTIILYQYERLDMLRMAFFKEISELIRSGKGPILSCLKSLNLLTDNGKDLHPFDNDMGLILFILLEGNVLLESLVLVHNVLKSNFFLLEYDILVSIIESVCNISDTREVHELDLVEECLNIFYVTAKYGQVPSSSLKSMIISLCKTLHINPFTHSSWDIINDIINTSGYSTIKILCEIIEESRIDNILRGAIFYLTMSVWGAKKHPNIDVPPISVLPSLLKAAYNNIPIVSLEIAIAMKRLIKKNGNTLLLEWEYIFQILERLRDAVPTVGNNQIFKATIISCLQLIKNLFLDAESRIEEDMIIEFRSLEICYSVFLPKEDSKKLLDEKISEIDPANEDWINEIMTLLVFFFAEENRTYIRTHLLESIKLFFLKYYKSFNEVCDVIISHMRTIYLDSSDIVVKKGMDLLIEIGCFVNNRENLLSITAILYNGAMSNAKLSSKKESVSSIISILKYIFTKRNVEDIMGIFHQLFSLLEHGDHEVKKDILIFFTSLRANLYYQLMIGDITNLQIKVKKRNNEFCQRIFEILVPIIQQENQELTGLALEALSIFLKNKFILYGVNMDQLFDIIILKIKLYWKKKTISFNQIKILTKCYNILILLMHFCTGDRYQSEQYLICFVYGINITNNHSQELFHNITRICLDGIVACYNTFPLIISEYFEKIISYVYVIVAKHEIGDITYIIHFLSVLSFYKIQLKSTDILKIIETLLYFINRFKYSSAIISHAYAVMARWFLFLTLDDRINCFNNMEVIIKKQVIDNKCLIAEAQLDLFARFAYLDCEPIDDLNNNEESLLFRDSDTKYWMLGNSIIQIRIGRFGWASVKVRRAAGSTSWKMKIENKLKSFGEDSRYSSELFNFLKGSVKSIPITLNTDNLENMNDNVDQSKYLKDDTFKEDFDIDSWEDDVISDDDFSWEHHYNDFDYYVQKMQSPVTTSPIEIVPKNIPLSSFYPPLPSYEELDDHETLSDSPTSAGSDPSKFLSIEEQMILHNASTSDYDEISSSFIDNAYSNTPEYKTEETNKINQLDSDFSQESSDDNIPLSSDNEMDLSDNDDVNVLQDAPSPIKLHIEKLSDSWTSNGYQIHPSFIFLQLRNIPFIENSLPIELEYSDKLDRAINELDRRLATDTHKIAVIYVGKNQSSDQDAILDNVYGSIRYTNFLRTIGSPVVIGDNRATYSGGLRNPSEDGEYSIFWSDDVTQVMFHVVTLMPNLQNDSLKTNKKRHIGNDYVRIVFTDDDHPFNPDVIQGQFNYVSIVVSPLDKGYFLVDIHKKPEVPTFGPISSGQIVHVKNLSVLVRTTAIHANIMVNHILSESNKVDYLSNAEYRLQQFKHIRNLYTVQ